MEALLPGLTHAPHLHPAFVHLPLALFMVAPLFLFLGAARKRDDLFSFGLWLVFIGLAGASAAIGTGLSAEEQLGHDSPHHDLVHEHKNWMLVSAGLATLVAVAAVLLRRRMTSAYRWVIASAMLVTAVVTTLGADRGAHLVLNHGIGTRVAPGEEVEPPPHRHH
jgi:uncharacterized membrane protein